MRLRLLVGRTPYLTATVNNYAEVHVGVDQATDLIQFLLNDNDFNYAGSLFMRNQSLIANIKSGKPFSVTWMQDWRYNLSEADKEAIMNGRLVKCLVDRLTEDE